VAVEIFGSRYGTPQPPQEDFSIYLCNAKFEVLKEFKVPYARFERGAERWVKIDLPATEVPEFFYLCVSFNPTATKSVYVGFDKNTALSHSRIALPDSHVADAPEFDWMLRCYLKPRVEG
jgi:RNA polymerase sigma-70 factor (ECF subfamily)